MLKGTCGMLPLAKLKKSTKSPVSITARHPLDNAVSVDDSEFAGFAQVGDSTVGVALGQAGEGIMCDDDSY